MYVGVPKLEEAVAHVERMGGSALSPVIDVPNVGRMRTMKDPQGADVLALRAVGPPQRPEAEPELGDVSWHELYTTDAEAAMKFYTELFGWRPTESMDMGPMGKYHMFGRGVSHRRHDEQAAGDGAGPAELGSLFPGATTCTPAPSA